MSAASRQRDAADATRSVWVAASAGTGKTTVLTDRVLTLLLSGSPPSRILCLTFTRAAAAEMANRLHERLSRWTVLDEAALAGELRTLLGSEPERATIDEARRLFARVLDAPSRLRIETIHAFCQSLMRRFPVEAGVAPHFELLDERGGEELLAEVREEILAAARNEGEGRLAAAVAVLARRVGEEKFIECLATLAAARGRFRALAARPGGVDRALADLAGRLGLPPGQTEARVIEAASAEGAFDGPALRQAAAAMTASQSADDKSRGGDLAAWLAEPDLRPERFGSYLRVFFTKDGDPRARIVAKKVSDSSPATVAALSAESARLQGVRRDAAAAVYLEATAAVTHLALAMLAAYDEHKRRRTVLDFEDLIANSIALLERPGVAPWVLFKLDGGLDHLLIDEAQDTNPDQWRVVEKLSAEFFAGAGARERIRTVFAVGDPKQSIFSFQGADPAAFLAMRRHFAERAEAAAAGWGTVALETSFRSTDAVLAAVDAVFAKPDAAAGVALDGAAIRHEAHRKGASGRVELWPLVVSPKKETSVEWELPLERDDGTDAQPRLAEAIAATIKGWLDNGEALPARGRSVQAGDIMVLVRRRTDFVAALVRELKDRGVPVAGVDRMTLTDQLAVEDMIALGQFLLLPEDDLTLAAVLKGPLFGFDEDRLYALAYGRGKRSLWSELYRRRGENPVFEAAADELAKLLARADFVPPYELFAAVLGPGGGRRKILARLGPEAADPLDEFLAAALTFERDHPPSLQGFLHWLVAGETEIKRDLEQATRDEVRVLTVHGAKGLEAPIVIVPDTTGVPSEGERERLQWTPDGMPLWRAPGGRIVPFLEELRAAAAQRRGDEYRRLLYVAMTRAADRLYICGWRPKKAMASDCWYELARRGLEGAAGVRREAMSFLGGGGAGWSGEGLVLETAQRAEPKPDAAVLVPAELAGALPEWIGRPPPAEPAPPKPLAPSRPAGSEPAVRSPLGEDDGAGFKRGRLVHRLLQSLPDLASERRAEAAARFLASPVHDLAPEAQREIAAEALAVLSDPGFAALFGPDSRAEVPVVGMIGARALAGQIDRLVVTDDTVLIVDHKTQRPAPASERDVPAIYLDQLASYAAALAAIYPGKEIRAALLWTDGPRLMPISPALLRSRSP